MVLLFAFLSAWRRVRTTDFRAVAEVIPAISVKLRKRKTNNNNGVLKAEVAIVENKFCAQDAVGASERRLSGSLLDAVILRKSHSSP